MEAETLARRALEALQLAGAEQAQCHLTEATKQELNAEWNEPSLLRSTFEHRLDLTAIVDGKKGVLSFNETSPSSIERAAREVVAMARASRADPANAIAEAQPKARFESGPMTPSLDGMHHRMQEFLAYREQNHPQTTMRALHFDFTRASSVMLNSNGVDLQATTGAYTFVASFSSRSGADTSSFNFSAACARDLDTPVSELGSFERLLRQSGEQVRTDRVSDLVPSGKFVGDLVVTPDCLGSFLGPISRYLGDEALISGTSIYQGKLGERVADTQLTLHSRPLSDEMAAPSFFTRDGYVCEDSTIIDQGVLRTFLLSQYGARKTGLSRAANEGDAWMVEPGQTPLDELIGGVERGVLLCRFSGGRPSASGDFSGIAKNSYLILDGKLGPPLSETMVSGNLVRLLDQLRGVSQERVHFGFAVFPWVAMSGATIS